MVSWITLFLPDIRMCCRALLDTLFTLRIGFHRRPVKYYYRLSVACKESA
jgi:hypothetical protein